MRWFLFVFLLGSMTVASAQNPACQVSLNQARADLLEMLQREYPDAYSTQKMLLDHGVNSYQVLCSIPSEPASDRVLSRLTEDYYPHFATIKMLYEHNMKAYRALQQ